MFPPWAPFFFVLTAGVVIAARNKFRSATEELHERINPRARLSTRSGVLGVRTGVTVSRTPGGSLTQIASTVISNSIPSATPRTEAALPLATAIATFR